ncbi:MAG: hypothetical protein KKE71_06665, partial [Nanoarchaeota archaeon]|nr:hypothetical protein [Nanoarchaeota archaeon]
MKLFFCVMFALLFVNCACAQAATLNASDYTTIQAAIDNSTSGDIIFISNGTYYERLNINKSISLIGESSTGVIIDGDYSIYETLSPIHDYWSGCSVLIIQSDVDDFNGYNISNLTLNITLRGDVVSIYADNVSLSNLTLQSSRGYFADAVLYLQGNSANIFNIITKETCNGVYIVSENNYIDNVFTPFDNSTLKGISLIGAKNNTVTNSITSFYIRSGAEDNYFENNTVKAREKNGIKMNSGMSLAESNKNRIKNNKVAGRLDLFNSNNNCITYNEISDILYTYASYNNSFEDNSAPILESNGVKIDVSAYQLPPLLLLNNITVYFELTSSLVVNENNTVEVRIYYNKTLVTLLGILPSKLSIKYYNETSLAWENIPSSVNEKEGYVFAVLTHL